MTSCCNHFLFDMICCLSERSDGLFYILCGYETCPVWRRHSKQCRLESAFVVFPFILCYTLKEKEMRTFDFSYKDTDTKEKLSWRQKPIEPRWNMSKQPPFTITNATIDAVAGNCGTGGQNFRQQPAKQPNPPPDQPHPHHLRVAGD